MWKLAGVELESRLLIGTARYSSPEIMRASILASGASVVTVSLRRHGSNPSVQSVFWDALRTLSVRLLPNTAGCHSVKEAVATAKMARELFDTNWIKLEVIGDDYNLQPDPFGLVEAARILSEDGFEVFPYMTDDLVLAEKLLDAGCKLLMPWASPIGSGQGIVNPGALATLRQRFLGVPIIVDAGLGKPSHAAEAMEMGFDGVLLNTAVALAEDSIHMARAFALAVEGGRSGFEAGLMPPRNFAEPSTPVVGTPFWHGK
ncbi:MAG: thiazole synthase [Nitrospinae bacterium]|nr:thiazole synthase [Nitrospinota bacterium]